ncbi:MAG: NAD(P)H-binding protein [Brevinematia bacterium]
MTVFLTGANGFIGKNVLEKLLYKNIKIIALVRDRKKMEEFIEKFSPKTYLRNLELIEGDLLLPESYYSKLKNVDIVINLVGIRKENQKKGITFWKYNFETAKQLVRVSLENNVKRFLQLSTIGASGTTKYEYFLTKYKAEKYVVESFENWIIVRPSIVIGPEGTFTKKIYSYLKLGIVPIPGDGNYKLQPISITTLSNFISYIATEEKITKKEFNLLGPKEYTFNELIDTFSEIIKKKNYIKLHLSPNLIKILSKIVGDKILLLSIEEIETFSKIFNYWTDETKPIKNIPIEEEIKKLR